MAEYLPINKSDIVTPYNVSAKESASLVETANERAFFVRRGGFHFTMTMGLRPYNIIRDDQNSKYWKIVTFLATHSNFYVPLYPAVENSLFETKPAISLDGNVEVGNNIISVDRQSGLRAGDFIKIGNKDKIHQVLRHEGYQIELTQPISHKGTDSDSIIYHERNENCIFGLFLNLDFGEPISRIEDGILGSIGPLTLKEKL